MILLEKVKQIVNTYETLEKELERLGLGTYQIFEDAPNEAEVYAGTR